MRYKIAMQWFYNFDWAVRCRVQQAVNFCGRKFGSTIESISIHPTLVGSGAALYIVFEYVLVLSWWTLIIPPMYSFFAISVFGLRAGGLKVGPASVWHTSMPLRMMFLGLVVGLATGKALRFLTIGEVTWDFVPLWLAFAGALSLMYVLSCEQPPPKEEKERKLAYQT